MFSEKYYEEIKAAFQRQMLLLDERSRELEEPAEEEGDGRFRGLCRGLLAGKKEEILAVLERCTVEEAQALTFLYSAMPLSDLLDYPAALFLTYAKHGVFLWNQGPFAGRVPEKLFANYVLHYRVNNEDIADTRGFFYEKLKKAVPLKEMAKAAVEANYWCAGEATYRSTDGRTQNARTMYGTATGRCGEESTMLTTVLRSIGIPARQVYAPLWSHCDDNHAWVEAWCDGRWYFLGACEPEERMDTGWFIGPASRALLLHSRWFGKDAPEELAVGPKGMAKVLNHTARYAHASWFTVKAVDEAGRPVPRAKVAFQVFNHGGLGTVAEVYTSEESGEPGIAKLFAGHGSLYISVSAEGLYGEAFADNREGGGECVVTLKGCPEVWEGWRELDFHAPVPGRVNDGSLTPEQESVGKRRLSEMTARRQEKQQRFYDAGEAARVLGRFPEEDRETVDEILHKACGNMAELVKFLEWDAAVYLPLDWQTGRTDHWKVEFLKSLREKDYWDTGAEVLIDSCICALPYAGSVPDNIFFRYLACPRVFNEMLRPCRVALSRCLDRETAEAVRRDPGRLPGWVEKRIHSLPGQEYDGLVTSPLGCLRGGFGSHMSREVFCVDLCRSLGVPVRLNPLSHSLEFYQNGTFVKAEEEPGKAAAAENALLVLRSDGSLKLEDWEHYSLERFEEGNYVRVGLWSLLYGREGEELSLSLQPGLYRAVTVNRKKNGDQLVRMASFALGAGERRELTLSVRQISLKHMLTDVGMEDLTLRTLEGGRIALSELAGGGRALLLWLAVTREPTEHILNEIYDRQEDFNRLNAPLYVVVREKEDLEAPTLSRTRKAVPKLTPLLDDFDGNYRAMAETVGEEPGRLPLVLILEGGRRCIYSDAGYNVGLADTLWKILTMEE